ncbi:hypothetical protein [Sinorhizobium mexicanum]|uniref:Uncharacterized protein n=1 Tax=Sinorhizobium mexicanum TaxID=375549 RepID=A0A859QPW2_9HYPH|nr:hypothetical protein [Sinorhizobium mexicanum]MBP1888232.1 hypothetical protein [Sinorhizobium mexicanum]QLL64127.1 hypothetical protein FKV68_22030 [Sinorhizobium mexicanum]
MSRDNIPPGWRTALVILATANAVALCLQPLLATLFLNGFHSAFPIHGAGARTAATLAFLCSIVATLTERQGITPKWLSLAFFIQFLVDALQFKLGEVAFREIHFLLGILLLIGGWALAVRVCRQPLPPT